MLRKIINGILILCFIGVLIFIYQNQINHHEDELEIINASTPIVYASGSLIHSAKEYLVDHLYESGESAQLVNKLLSLEPNVLIFLNDELIHVKTILATETKSYYNVADNELTFQYEDEDKLLQQFDESFYYLIGEYIHQNMNHFEYNEVVEQTYESIMASNMPQWHDFLDDSVDYFAECVRLFYTDPLFLQSHEPSYGLITSVLSTIGLK